MQIAAHDKRGGGLKAYDDCGAGSQLLLRELTHRINNELASTVGYVTSIAARSADPHVKAALGSIIDHIVDYARIYRALQMPAADQWIDASEYLRELCQSISIAKLQHRKIELCFRESSVTLNALRCWRMGMIVSELITNASRHAFCGCGGTIQVELSKRGALVECSVTDSGSSVAEFRPGQGSSIIQSLARELDGRVRYRFGAAGTIATLSFPLAWPESKHIDGNRFSAGETSPL